LQSTPTGDLVIVTLEGDDPARAMELMSQQDDEFTRWFLEQTQRAHGSDPAQPAELVADSEAG
jgi:hypothetical protein